MIVFRGALFSSEMLELLVQLLGRVVDSVHARGGEGLEETLHRQVCQAGCLAQAHDSVFEELDRQCLVDSMLQKPAAHRDGHENGPTVLRDQGKLAGFGVADELAGHEAKSSNGQRQAASVLETSRWKLFAVLGILGAGLSFILYVAGLKHTAPTVASVLAMVEPVTAALLGVVVLSETLAVPQVFGMALILLTVTALSANSRAQIA